MTDEAPALHRGAQALICFLRGREGGFGEVTLATERHLLHPPPNELQTDMDRNHPRRIDCRRPHPDRFTEIILNQWHLPLIAIQGGVVDVSQRRSGVSPFQDNLDLPERCPLTVPKYRH